MSHCLAEVLSEAIQSRQHMASICLASAEDCHSPNKAIFVKRAADLHQEMHELAHYREQMLATEQGLAPAPIEVHLGFCMGMGRLSRMVSRLDAIDGQPSPWSHVYWRFSWATGPSLIYESMVGHGVTITPRERFMRAVGDGRITSVREIRLNIPAPTMQRLWNACVNLHAQPYDTRHILGLYIWIRGHSRKMNRRPWWLRKAMNDRYICSEFTYETAHQAGINLLGDWSTPETTTPHSQWIIMREAEHA